MCLDSGSGFQIQLLSAMLLVSTPTSDRALALLTSVIPGVFLFLSLRVGSSLCVAVLQEGLVAVAAIKGLGCNVAWLGLA